MIREAILYDICSTYSIMSMRCLLGNIKHPTGQEYKFNQIAAYVKLDISVLTRVLIRSLLFKVLLVAQQCRQEFI